MSEIDRSNSFSADDALPPVEPPSAGFLVQLFVIPGVIVAIIVVVWMLFHWLAAAGSDPKKYIEALRGHGENRYQVAASLATALRDPSSEPLRREPAVARELARILQDEMASGNMQPQPVNLRIFLCMAIGQFSTSAGLPALLEAATTERDPVESGVRLAAMKGIGDLAKNVRAAGGALRDPKLMPTLLTASRDPLPAIRAAAALALGAMGDSDSQQRLVQLLDDENTTVRYDAAVALAQNDNLEALATLREMLDTDQTIALRDVAEPMRMQALIHATGLAAVSRLVDAHPEADFESVGSAIDRLTHSNFPEVRDQAIRLREKLSQRQRVLTPAKKP